MRTTASMDEESFLTRLRSVKINRSFLNVLFGLALLVYIVISILSYKEVSNLIQANKWLVHTYEVIDTINNSLYGFSQMESEQRAFLASNDKRFLEDSAVFKNTIAQNLEKLVELTKNNPDQIARIDNFKKLIERRMKLLRELIVLKNNNQLHTFQGMYAFSLSNEASTEVKITAQEMKSVEMVLLKERDHVLQHQTNVSRMLIILGNIIGLVLLIVAFVLVHLELTNRKNIEFNDKKNRSFLRQIIESTSDMIAAFDKTGKFKIFNESYHSAFKRLFGKSLVINMEVSKLEEGIPESKSSLFQIWKESLNPENLVKIMEFDQDNNKIFYELSSYDIQDGHDVRGTVHCMRDISIRIQEQHKLQESHKQQAEGIKKLEIKNEQITLMVEMSDIMLAANSQEELIVIMSKYAQRLLDFAAGYLFMMHPSKNSLEQVGSWGKPQPQEKLLKPEQCWAIRLGRMHLTSHDRRELLCSHIQLQKKDNVRGCMCLPLMAQNDIYGMLYIEFTDDASIKNTEKKLLITAFAELTALAMANVRLRENLRYQSIRDPLTGLYNRRYLEDALSRQIHQSSRAQSEFAVIMLDLDHFKKINDTFGHDAGDMVLKEMTDVMKLSLRAGDIVARFGGEEFIIIFHDIDLKQVKMKAEKIKLSISKMNVRYGTQNIGPLTVSMGISMYPQDSREMDSLIEYADKGLYHAKETGRNRICAFAELSEPGVH